MASEQSIWYKLGYALEQARGAGARPGRTLQGIAERATPKRATRNDPPASRNEAVEDLITTGAVALAAKLLDGWRPRGKAGFGGLLRAGAAGAAAALAVELVKPWLEGRLEPPALDAESAERILSGAGQGLIYGAVVEPRIPGPPLLKGALYGSAEYAVVPAGGLVKLLRPHGPLRGVPFVSGLLEGAGGQERTYIEHVVFGISLALLYGSSPASNGIRVDRES